MVAARAIFRRRPARTRFRPRRERRRASSRKNISTAVRGVESSLDEAERSDSTDAERKERSGLADGITQRGRSTSAARGAGVRLAARSGVARARKHAKAAAHALDDLSLKEVPPRAPSYFRRTLDQCRAQPDPERRNCTNSSTRKRVALRQASWTGRTPSSTRMRALSPKPKTWATIASKRRADTMLIWLSVRRNSPATPSGREGERLPGNPADQLGRAGSVMQEAAKELAAGHGERGSLRCNVEAQRLLGSRRVPVVEIRRTPTRTNKKAGLFGRQARQAELGRDNRSATRTGTPSRSAGTCRGPDDKRAGRRRRRRARGLGKEKSERPRRRTRAQVRGKGFCDEARGLRPCRLSGSLVVGNDRKGSIGPASVMDVSDAITGSSTSSARGRCSPPADADSAKLRPRTRAPVASTSVTATRRPRRSRRSAA